MVVETTRVSGLKVVEVAGKDVEEAVAVDQVVQAVVSWAWWKTLWKRWEEKSNASRWRQNSAKLWRAVMRPKRRSSGRNSVKSWNLLDSTWVHKTLKVCLTNNTVPSIMLMVKPTPGTTKEQSYKRSQRVFLKPAQEHRLLKRLRLSMRHSGHGKRVAICLYMTNSHSTNAQSRLSKFQSNKRSKENNPLRSLFHWLFYHTSKLVMTMSTSSTCASEDQKVNHLVRWSLSILELSFHSHKSTNLRSISLQSSCTRVWTLEPLRSALKSSKKTTVMRVPPSRPCRETNEYLPRIFRVVLKPLRTSLTALITEINLEAFFGFP